MAFSIFQKSLFSQIGIASAVLGVLITLTVLVGGDIERRVTYQRTLRDEERFRSEAILSFVTLRSEYERAQIYFSLLESLLPHQDRLLNFPKDMRAIGKKHSVDVTVVFGQEVVGTPTTPGSIQFNMVTRGTFANLLLFLDEVKRSSYVVDLGSMELAWGAKDTSATILGKVFSR